MVRVINEAEIAEKKAAGEKLTFVDVSPLSEYQELKIAGALHIPLGEIRAKARSYLPNPAREIIVYGLEVNSSDAWSAASLLEDLGYANVFFYPAGKRQWARLAYDIERVHFPPPPPTQTKAA